MLILVQRGSKCFVGDPNAATREIGDIIELYELHHANGDAKWSTRTRPCTDGIICIRLSEPTYNMFATDFGARPDDIWALRRGRTRYLFFASETGDRDCLLDNKLAIPAIQLTDRAPIVGSRDRNNNVAVWSKRSNPAVVAWPVAIPAKWRRGLGLSEQTVTWTPAGNSILKDFVQRAEFDPAAVWHTDTR
jgi:hypothetical protein